AGAFSHAIDHFLRQRVASGQLANHLPHLMAVEWRERDRAVMRADTPRRPKLRPGGDENEQWRQRPAFGKQVDAAAQFHPDLPPLLKAARQSGLLLASIAKAITPAARK